MLALNAGVEEHLVQILTGTFLVPCVNGSTDCNQQHQILPRVREQVKPVSAPCDNEREQEGNLPALIMFSSSPLSRSWLVEWGGEPLVGSQAARLALALRPGVSEWCVGAGGSPKIAGGLANSAPNEENFGIFS